MNLKILVFVAVGFLVGTIAFDIGMGRLGLPRQRSDWTNMVVEERFDVTSRWPVWDGTRYYLDGCTAVFTNAVRTGGTC